MVLKLNKADIKKEVEHAIMMAEELRHDAGKMDTDDIEDYATRIQLVLKRVQHGLLK
ncbi:hypothetical protein HY639_00465 [Candidatus Woesearchaeota archaeon]|nr:hypothetical protein [Candidatus Woesearchaeota archaeon]